MTSEFRDEMRDVGIQVVRSGMVLASGGNLSVRGPGAGRFVVTARGSYLDRLGPEAFTSMDLDGSVLDGPEPSSEWRLHQQTYLARPDVSAIVHLHPEYTVLLDAIGEPIRQLTLDHVAYVPETIRIPFYPNGSQELARAAGDAARGCDVVVLGNHGCSAVGETPLSALRKAVNLESAARATYRLLLLGDRTTEFPRALRAGAIHRG